MYWTLGTAEVDEPMEFARAGRFVVHRHVDAQGAHLDLRLETDDALRGWRIDATELEGEVWATEKQAHPKRWLDDSGDAEVIDAGMYAVESESSGEVTLLLEGRGGVRRVQARQAAEMPASTLGTIVAALERAGAKFADAPGLIADGVAARTRAIARLCGLARELDGAAFEEGLWKKSLSALGLEEIHAQLRAFEVRFDARYPVGPVSRPERIEEGDERRDARALAIVRG